MERDASPGKIKSKAVDSFRDTHVAMTQFKYSHDSRDTTLATAYQIYIDFIFQHFLVQTSNICNPAHVELQK